jgi:hypothetical protein
MKLKNFNDNFVGFLTNAMNKIDDKMFEMEKKIILTLTNVINATYGNL